MLYPDLLVFSHLRWNFVFQRPQHLITRQAEYRRVYYIEEPVFSDNPMARLEFIPADNGVNVVVPHLPHGLTPDQQTVVLRKLMDGLVLRLDRYVAWYYTPMALEFTRHLNPEKVIFDCMDELSHFKFAPPQILRNEAELLERADLVFVGGKSLFEAKRHRHRNIHLFPSSIDRAHFANARKGDAEPEDQRVISGPKLGFFGVIDERMDLDLLAGVAALRPKWNFVMIGPVVKIDPASLPKASNIHYLGQKSYADLPRYVGGWDCALMPFARNDATRFISPTKTPEYLAAGRPVVSTSIQDVIDPYAHEGLAYIADEPESFVQHCEHALRVPKVDSEWIVRVDEFLSFNSWDLTFKRMLALERTLDEKRSNTPFFVPRPPSDSLRLGL
jgi:UDP-galactopyranose mutase